MNIQNLKLVLEYTNENEKGFFQIQGEQAAKVLEFALELEKRKYSVTQSVESVMKPIALNKPMFPAALEKSSPQETSLVLQFQNIISSDNQTKTVILFNAPPKSGKDLACEILQGIFSENVVAYQMFKEILYIKTSDLLHINLNDWIDICQNQELKDKPRFSKSTKEALLDYKTIPESLRDSFMEVQTAREMLIFLAEKVLKPNLGSDFIAQYTATKVHNLITNQGKNLVLIPDLGFHYELAVIYNLHKKLTGKKLNLIVVNIDRDGCTFNNDSRDFVGIKPFYNTDNCKIRLLNLNNNGSKEDFSNLLISELLKVLDTLK